MDTVVSNFRDALKMITSMSWSDVLDVLLVAVLVYAVIAFLRRTNSTKVAQGILLLLIALWLATAMRLTLTALILRQVFGIGVLAVVILFQPEIRRALERVGSYRIFSFLSKEFGSQLVEQAIMQTVYACKDMSRSRTGALIVFERVIHLDEQIVSGTLIDGEVSAELLKNIFFDKSPLHDGAVIVRDGRLAAAGCMLPLSTSSNLSRELGMRHRAGIGMSEHSDAVVVIVSEETGSISVAVDGLLKRHLSVDTCEALLRKELIPEVEPKRGWRVRLKFAKGKNNGKRDKK